MIFLIFLSTLASLILAGTNKYKASMIFFSISLILLLAVFIPHTIRYINIQL
ncbi:hypothetical protein [Francisella adeliensis]|uniref:hypothetical protein n=1 Tax=Francisella adeliensis TaxID=2007306 RepID=UPI001571E79C|nr:hypothetical protein [Francisella adeliensis]MBK2084690.1 hypothetical protein [Francisella adeliensis]MBK2096199.1 hypothetical protein [Francisella adeliensis]